MAAVSERAHPAQTRQQTPSEKVHALSENTRRLEAIVRRETRTEESSARDKDRSCEQVSQP